MKKLVCMIILCGVVLAGCAGRQANPIAVYQPGDEGRGCMELRSEIAGIEGQMQRLQAQTEESKSNTVWEAAGSMVLLPFFFIDTKKAEKAEYDALCQRHNRLQQIAAQKNCGNVE